MFRFFSISVLLMTVSVAWLAPMLATNSVDTPAAKPVFLHKVAWSERGTWVKADTHMHTVFSDGSKRVDEVVSRGIRYGCDVLAITDHADQSLSAATPEYFDAIDAARLKHPDRIIFAGLEWNVPPWDGREHAVVLFPPSINEREILPQFKARFDDLNRERHDPALAVEAIRWLSEQADPDGIAPLVIYEHPNRKRNDPLEFIREFRALYGVTDRLRIFSGAPGHQRSNPLGSYEGPFTTRDRWDPALADGARHVDLLLREGLDVWSALAPSDFHGPELDYWPGEFSETWLFVPEKSANGVLRALAAGTFFGAHGHIAREVQIQVNAPGLERPAYVGEAIEVDFGSEVELIVQFQASETDWQRRPNRIDDIEFVTVGKDHSRTTAIPNTATGRLSTARLAINPTEDVVVYARGRRVVESGPDLLFYTNSVRIRARPNPSLLSAIATRLSAVRRTFGQPRRPGAARACGLAFSLLALSLSVGGLIVTRAPFWQESNLALLNDRGESLFKSLAGAQRSGLGSIALWFMYLVPLWVIAALTYGGMHGATGLDGTVVVVIASVLCVTLAPVIPVLGPIAYLIATYSASSGLAEPTVLGLQFTTWIAISNIAAVGVRAVCLGTWPLLSSGPVVRIVLVLMGWIALAVLASVVQTRPLVPGLTHRTARFLECCLMFLAAAAIVWRSIDFSCLAVSLGVLLCVRGVLEREQIYLDNNLSMLSAMAFPLAVGAAIERTRWPVKIACIVLSACLVGLTIYTQNRGAFVALCLAIITMVACSRRRAWLAIGALPLVLIFAIGFSQSGLFGRFREAYRDGAFQDSAAARLELWKAGWQMGREHLVWGVGPENFAVFAKKYNPIAETNSAHNSFIDMFAETGLPGALAYASLIAFTLGALIRTVIRSRATNRSTGPASEAENMAHRRRIHATAVLSSLVAFVTTGFFLSNFSLALAFILIGASTTLNLDRANGVS